MDLPLVSCTACHRAWHSTTMADGLRAVGQCPRCGGELAFSGPAATPAAESAPVGSSDATAPHLVLGLPRR